MTDLPQLPPAISIRATYRQLGPGPEEIEVSWAAGTAFPSVAELCAVLDRLTTISTTTEE
jgi:hypothetical protein